MSGSRDQLQLKVGLLKAFLVGCEARGWVWPNGRLSWLRVREARAYWVGLRVALGHTSSMLCFDADILGLSTARDPFVTASALHRTLCAEMHERRVG